MGNDEVGEDIGQMEVPSPLRKNCIREWDGFESHRV